jgi:hypothetical protein
MPLVCSPVEAELISPIRSPRCAPATRCRPSSIRLRRPGASRRPPSRRSSRSALLISRAASALRCARLRTSPATTAKPRPCSPARAASTAAFSARMLVWNAMPSITLMMSAIFFELVRDVFHRRHHLIHDLAALLGGALAARRELGRLARRVGVVLHGSHSSVPSTRRSAAGSRPAARCAATGRRCRWRSRPSRWRSSRTPRAPADHVRQALLHRAQRREHAARRCVVGAGHRAQVTLCHPAGRVAQRSGSAPSCATMLREITRPASATRTAAPPASGQHHGQEAAGLVQRRLVLAWSCASS